MAYYFQCVCLLLCCMSPVGNLFQSQDLVCSLFCLWPLWWSLYRVYFVPGVAIFSGSSRFVRVGYSVCLLLCCMSPAGGLLGIHVQAIWHLFLCLQFILYMSVVPHPSLLSSSMISFVSPFPRGHPCPVWQLHLIITTLASWLWYSATWETMGLHHCNGHTCSPIVWYYV